MNHLVRVLVLGSLIAAGCGKKKEAPPEPTKVAEQPSQKGPAEPGDCDALGKRTATMSMEQTPPDTSDAQRAVLQKMSDDAGAAIAAMCKADKWTAEAVKCGLAAKDPSVECNGKLTPEQQKRLETEVQAIFTRGQADYDAAGSAPPPAGSAAPAE